jgi:hypothetical protein
MDDTIISRTKADDLRKRGARISTDRVDTSYTFRKSRSGYYVYNQTQEDTRKHGYCPKISLWLQQSKVVEDEKYLDRMTLEFSCQKAVNENSYYMINGNDYPQLRTNLSLSLRRLGIDLAPQHIGNLSVSGVAVSWNVILPDSFGDSVKH